MRRHPLYIALLAGIVGLTSLSFAGTALAQQPAAGTGAQATPAPAAHAKKAKKTKPKAKKSKAAPAKPKAQRTKAPARRRAKRA